MKTLVLKEDELTDLLKLAPEDFPRPKQLTIQTQSPDPDAFLEHLFLKGLAIVGTRNPQIKSLQHLERTVASLQGTKTVIVSGLARGIDAAAHEAALKNGLPTIAFLGAGISVNYPQQNARLRQRILDEGGMIISEFQDLEPPRPAHFLARNRWLAYFSKATWVVEGMTISGSLNTAAWATQLGRDLYSTACFPGDPALSGNQRLLEESHATALFSAQSLKGTWLDLEIQVEKRQKNSGPRTAMERDILKLIRAEVSRSGAVHSLNLREKCLELGWEMRAFQTGFQALILRQEIEEKAGWITLQQPALRSL